jgi:hypothetical protein
MIYFVAGGRMPSLEEFLRAVKETREIYQPKNPAARKAGK